MAGPIWRFDAGHRPGVRDGSDGAPVPGQARHRAAGPSGGFGDRPAAGVDVALRAGEPVGDLEARVAQRLRQRGLQGTRRGRLVQAGRDPGDGAALGPGADDPRYQPGGEQGDRYTPGREDREQGSVERVLDRGLCSATARATTAAANPIAGTVTGSSRWRAGREARASRAAQTAIEGERGGGGEPAVGDLDGARQRRQRADQEDVDGAVRQAARVEVRVPEQRQGGRGQQRLGVDDGHQRAGRLGTGPAGRVGEHQVDR